MENIYRLQYRINLAGVYGTLLLALSCIDISEGVPNIELTAGHQDYRDMLKTERHDLKCLEYLQKQCAIPY